MSPPMPRRLARTLERRLSRHLAPLTGIDAADLRQEVSLQWWQASQRFDRARGVSLEAYASRRVLGCLSDIWDQATHHGHLHYVPLPMLEATDDSRRWLLPPVPPVEREVWLRRVVNRLPRWPRYILIRAYWSEWPLAAIGRVMGVSESRVCQVRAQTLRHLRRALEGADGGHHPTAEGR